MSYEFETKAQLGKVNDLDLLLERSLELKYGRTRALENFASMYVVFNACQFNYDIFLKSIIFIPLLLDVALTSCKDVKSFGIKALKLAIKCYLEEENLNLESLR